MKQNPHPWKRFFARSLDLLVFQLVLLVIVYPSFNISIFEPMFYYGFLILLVIWIPIEALFIFKFGCTPAKWLYGISITNSEGEKLNYFLALKRTLHVWAIGNAFAIPPISLIMNGLSYRYLLKHGTTWWDIESKSVVKIKSWGVVRTFFATTITLFIPHITARIMQSGGLLQKNDFALVVLGSIMVGAGVALIYGVAILLDRIFNKKNNDCKEEVFKPLETKAAISKSNIKDFIRTLKHKFTTKITELEEKVTNGDFNKLKSIAVISIITLIYFVNGLYKVVSELLYRFYKRVIKFIVDIYINILKQFQKIIKKGIFKNKQ